jgi:hypothetical protein
MAPDAPILAALAKSCRTLSNINQLQLTDKKEVFEFHLEWLDLCTRYRDSASTKELTKQTESDDLALRMAQFIVNHAGQTCMPPVNESFPRYSVMIGPPEPNWLPS